MKFFNFPFFTPAPTLYLLYKMNEGHFWPSLFLQIRLDLVAQQVPCDDAVLGREAVDKVRAVEQLGTGREFVVARPQEHAQAIVPQQGELEACVAGRGRPPMAVQAARKASSRVPKLNAARCSTRPVNGWI